MTLNWSERLNAIGLSAEEVRRKAEAMDGVDGVAAWWIPGRIEFLGKHTDYAGGRSLLCATERGFCIAGLPRTDDQIIIKDARSGERVQNAYTEAVQSRLTRNFGRLQGADITLWSDLPVASGLSSSSALVVGLSVILIQLNDLDERKGWRAAIADADALAEYLSAVENGYSFGALDGDRGVGTLNGSEDHTAITRSIAGRLIRYSFSPVLASGSVPLPEGHVFVVAASGVTAEKNGATQTAYNDLARLAANALTAWNEATARNDSTLDAALDSSPDSLDRMSEVLSPEHFIRVEQFHSESKILIPAAFEALKRGDLATLGTVVQRSHDGAERALRNQVPETTSLVHSARELGATAASAFGAGWGGSVWALVPGVYADDFITRWEDRYIARFPNRDGLFFRTRAASAARKLL